MWCALSTLGYRVGLFLRRPSVVTSPVLLGKKCLMLTKCAGVPVGFAEGRSLRVSVLEKSKKLIMSPLPREWFIKRSAWQAL